MTLNNNYSFDDILIKDCEDYQCKGCFLLIYNKTPYQCREGVWRCKGCWGSDEMIKCPEHDCICNTRSMSDLSKNESLKIAFNKKKVYCPNLFKFNNKDNGDKDSETPAADANAMLRKDEEFGCKEIFRVNGLESHLKSCQHRFIECTNNGCKEVIRFNRLNQHLDQCEWVPCDLCNIGVLKSNLRLHSSKCKSTTIPCNQCQTLVERGNLLSHIEQSCSQTEISCKLKSEGCESMIKRSELSNHLKDPSHIELLIHAYEKQSIENSILNLQLANQGEEIANQSLKISNQSLEITNLESIIINSSNDIIALRQLISQLTTVVDSLSLSTNKKFEKVSEKLTDNNNEIMEYRNQWEILNFPITGSNQDLKSSVYSYGKFYFNFEISKYGIGDSITIYFCSHYDFKPFKIEIKFFLRDKTEKKITTDIKPNEEFNQFYVGSVGPADNLLTANGSLIFTFSMKDNCNKD